MKKLLFMIPNLGHGGAEKVLVNLVNHMDKTKFDITVMTLYDEGVNKKFLAPHIKYKSCFRKSFKGISHTLKLFSPYRWYSLLVHEEYDIVVSYLEGQTARIVSGCPNSNTKLISWIHVEQHSEKNAARSFRTIKEMKKCYGRFDRTVCVSEYVKNDFLSIVPVKSVAVLYNTIESEKILLSSNEKIDNIYFSDKEIKLCGIGTLKKSKGFDRLLKVHSRLKKQGYPIHTYILGEGPDRSKLERLAEKLGISESVTFLGYQINPYKYLRKSDIFVCTSFAEGFSTAATEALIVGTPVCTVEVSGMKEMLGEKNEYGIVTDNSTKAFYIGLKRLLDSPIELEYYKKQASIRGSRFSTESTVEETEKFLMELLQDEEM